jgi:2-polyprenyl-6-hydroxyphenyl methylase/3-demethylubiquinone-9 3-methyltransferase
VNTLATASSAHRAERDVSSPSGISLDTVAALAAALLIYVSGSFLAAEIAGVKRHLQMILMVPIVVTAVYHVVSRPARLLDLLIYFVIVRTAVEVALRGQLPDLFDNLMTLLALIVIRSVPVRSFGRAASFVVVLAGVLAAMALVQWVLLFFFPDLGAYRLVISKEGVIESTVRHPIVLLGLFGEQEFTFLGHAVARLQSFTREPSQNVVYFLLPASLAFLLDRRWSRILGAVILVFCVLSFSGSVYLSLVFATIWWSLSWIVSLRFALSYGILLALGAYIFAIKRFGFEPMLQGIAYIAQYGDFLGRTVSLTDRGSGAVLNMDVALASPFGSSALSDIAGPWLINVALAAGWLGVLLLVLFLRKLSKQLEVLNSSQGFLSATRIGSLLLLGAMSTIIVFNDYPMSTYVGLVLLAVIFRTLELRNQAVSGLVTRGPEQAALEDASLHLAESHMESAESQHAREIRGGERFAFGANWGRFIDHLSERRIQMATESLQRMLRVEHLTGRRFLDVGSGSGLSSLAAWRLGATVHSFDFDPLSVACTAELRRRYASGDARWTVETGSVLDEVYTNKLGSFDVVYSWGVLHHTGNLHRALQAVVPMVRPDGVLFIAIYNDQRWISKYWAAVKRLYNSYPVARPVIVAVHAPYLLGARLLVRAVTGRLQVERGMSLWHDMLDWLGGWPFEVARPADVVAFYASQGFTTRELHAVGRRHGCNEFVFNRAVAEGLD